jgi:hypothetical protein
MRNTFKLLWIIAIGAVIGFGLTGCDTGNGGGNGGGGNGGGGGGGGDDLKIVTFTLEKVNGTTFTLTVDGADWRNWPDDNKPLNDKGAYSAVNSLVYFAAMVERTSAHPYGGSGGSAQAGDFDLTVSGRVITASVKGPDEKYTGRTVTGLIKILDGTFYPYSYDVFRKSGDDHTTSGRPQGSYDGPATTKYVNGTPDGITLP